MARRSQAYRCLDDMSPIVRDTLLDLGSALAAGLHTMVQRHLVDCCAGPREGHPYHIIVISYV